MEPDLSKLTPAPWEVKHDEPSGSHFIPLRPEGGPMLVAEWDSPADGVLSEKCIAALHFAALAMNFKDVCERRLLSVRNTLYGNGKWNIFDSVGVLISGQFATLLDAWAAAVQYDKENPV